MEIKQMHLKYMGPKRMNFKREILQWVLPGIYLIILALGWGAVLIVKGTIGPYGWWLLMMFGMVAIIILPIYFMIFLVKRIRKRKVHKSFYVLIMLSLLASWPGGWFFGIGQIAYPAHRNKVEPEVYISLPVNHEMIVGWGGDTLEDNYHAWLPFERWAYDLMVMPAMVDSSNLEDYGIYGMEIVAPVSGTIVGAYDGYPDEIPNTDEADNMGNYVYLEIEETGTYLVIGHIKPNSLLVKEGEYVKEGTPLAQAGNSGMSSEPHVHIHHQRQNPNEVYLLAEGLPLYFRDIEGDPMPKGGGHRSENGKNIPNGQTIRPSH